MLRCVLDTNAAIHTIDHRLVRELGEYDEYIVSIVTEIELLSWRRMTGEEERRVRAFLRRTAITPLTETVKLAAIALRRDHGLKTPDAIIGGTALALGAVLVTNDKRLHGVPGLAAQALAVGP